MTATIADGYYEGEFSALFRRGVAKLRVEGGQLTGVTGRGVPLIGTYGLDPVRRTYRFEVTATMPPFFEAITGLKTGAQGRAVKYRGEATPLNGTVRFSIDFAGRAIDVALERLGPPEMADRVLPRVLVGA